LRAIRFEGEGAGNRRTTRKFHLGMGDRITSRKILKQGNIKSYGSRTDR
jgi:hypothetical protein